MLKLQSNRVRSVRTLVAAAAAGIVLAGCQTTNPFTGEQKISHTTWGTAAGAAGGAAIGAAAGGGKGALIGAGAGALAGGAVGYYMDQQEAKLRERLRNTGVSVTRQGDDIILNMPGNITFATNSSSIASNFYPVLDSVSLVINEYDKTRVDVIGHTDSRGEASYNQRLSEQRAQSVARYLESQQVSPQRILISGYGEQYPIASNDTKEGQALNRRVEIKLTPVRG